MHRRQIRPRKIDEFKRLPVLREEVTANDGVDRFFAYDDDTGAPQRVSRTELEARARAHARAPRRESEPFTRGVLAIARALSLPPVARGARRRRRCRGGSRGSLTASS